METRKAVLTSKSARETLAIGEFLGRLIDSPMVVALNGELGTGKSVLVKGAARGLGVTQPVRSPTFTLLNIYRGRLPLFHFDFYRLQDQRELEGLGLEEYLEGQGVAFVEWAEKFPAYLPDSRLEIYFEYDSGTGGEGRILSFFPQSDFSGNIVDRLLESNRYKFNGNLNPFV